MAGVISRCLPGGATITRPAAARIRALRRRPEAWRDLGVDKGAVFVDAGDEVSDAIDEAHPEK
jgi:hypothetical protein